MGLTKTYDPGKVSLLFGTTLLTGWNEITVERDEDGVMFSVGTSGEICRSINYNTLGSFTIIYPQSNDENETLSLYENTKLTLPLTLIDKSGTTVAIMEYGTVTKPASSKFGKESDNRSWVVKGNLPVFHVGGNNAES